MKKYTALLPFAVFIALAAAQASASIPPATLFGIRTHDPVLQPKFLKSVPVDTAAKPSHLFTVRDEKGLLLTCIAPEIDTNIDTDVFKNCTLAPERTLDDVMHTFIQTIHYEQSQHQKERDAWMKYLEEMSAQKNAQKH